MRTDTLRIAAAASLAALALPAAGNGINPPQLAAQVVVSAACTPRQPGEAVQIHRAKLGTDPATSGLVLKAPGADPRTVPLGQVERLLLPESTVDSEGFAAARVRMRAEAQEQELRVALSQAGQPVQLLGFSATGKAAAVDLAACSEVVFSGAGDAAPPPGGARAN